MRETCPNELSLFTFSGFPKCWTLKPGTLSQTFGLLTKFSRQTLTILRRQRGPNTRCCCTSALDDNANGTYGRIKFTASVQNRPFIDNRMSNKCHVSQINECQSLLSACWNILHAVYDRQVKSNYTRKEICLCLPEQDLASSQSSSTTVFYTSTVLNAIETYTAIQIIEKTLQTTWILAHQHNVVRIL